MTAPVDVVAVAPHPDDAELGCAGLLWLLKQRGLRTAIVDLTRGEMGTKGDPETRAAEAAAASRVLDLDVRINLDLGDGRLDDSADRRAALAAAFRQLRPRRVFCNYRGDRHPDHRAAWQLVQSANLWARLRKAPVPGDPHSIVQIDEYFIHDFVTPSYVAPLGDAWARKAEAVACYRSQFVEFDVPEGYRHIGTQNYLRDTETRARFMGTLIGAEFGEGYYTSGPLAVGDPLLLMGGAD